MNCDVIKDLIPLVNDGAASEESIRLVGEHCESCTDCRDLLKCEPIRCPKDEKIVKTLKKSVFVTHLAVVFIGILLGVWLTGSNQTFYNFYIMPFIGGLAYFTLRKKSLYVPLAVVVLTELVQLFKELPYLNAGFVQNLHTLGMLLYSTLFYAAIYAALSLTGIAIAFLSVYAFRREKR